MPCVYAPEQAWLHVRQVQPVPASQVLRMDSLQELAFVPIGAAPSTLSHCLLPADGGLLSKQRVLVASGSKVCVKGKMDRKMGGTDGRREGRAWKGSCIVLQGYGRRGKGVSREWQGPASGCNVYWSAPVACATVSRTRNRCDASRQSYLHGASSSSM